MILNFFRDFSAFRGSKKDFDVIIILWIKKGLNP